jgi:TPR repeat protein
MWARGHRAKRSVWGLISTIGTAAISLQACHRWAPEDEEWAACADSSPSACTSLAREILEIAITPIEVRRANALLLGSCRRGDAVGCVLLGQSYEIGKGLPKSAEKSVVLYQAATRHPAPTTG